MAGAIAKPIVIGSLSFDDSSRRILQQRHGIHKVGISFVSSNANKGVVDQIVDGHVVEDWDITALETGRAIVSAVAIGAKSKERTVLSWLIGF